MPQPNRTRKPATGIGHIQARKMYEYTMKHSGGTFTAMGTPIELRHGFVVSLDPDRGKVIPVREFAPTTLTVFVLNNQNYMLDYNTQHPEPMHGFKMIGTWIEDDEVHIDVVNVFATKDVDRVIDLARQHGQKAVYDFSTRKAIDVEKYTGQVI